MTSIDNQHRRRADSQYQSPTDADRGRITDAYKHGGLSVPKIAKAFNFSQNQVYGVLYTAGVELRSSVKTTDDQRREIRRLWGEGVVMRKLAATYSLGLTTIHRICHLKDRRRAKPIASSPAQQQGAKENEPQS